MKKVISFSLWGNSPALWDGMVENAELAERYYPGWEVWIHASQNEWSPPLQFCELSKIPKVSFKFNHNAVGWGGLFWRFAPIWNPEVTITLVRDCDSRLNPREASAVHEWLTINKWEPAASLHHMRDHIEHTTVPIMGGMCGFLHWPKFKVLLDEWTERDHKGADQEFLAEKVWPLLSQDALCHDRWPGGVYWDAGNLDNPPFHYEPKKFFGRHLRLPFPNHETYDEEHLGSHVGARIGL